MSDFWLNLWYIFIRCLINKMPNFLVNKILIWILIFFCATHYYVPMTIFRKMFQRQFMYYEFLLIVNMPSHADIAILDLYSFIILSYLATWRLFQKWSFNHPPAQGGLNDRLAKICFGYTVKLLTQASSNYFYRKLEYCIEYPKMFIYEIPVTLNQFLEGHYVG